MLNCKERNDILFQDLPDCNVTKESIEFIKSHPQYYRGNIKLMQGEVYTDKELEKFKKKVLNYRLPR